MKNINLGYIRCDRIEVGDLICPTAMSLNKRTWKVIEIESLGDRLLFKLEILGDDFPKTECPALNQETPGSIVKIDTTRDNKFPIQRSSDEN